MSGNTFVGFGLLAEYQSSASPLTFTAIDKVHKVTMPVIKVETVDVTAMDSPNRSKQKIASIQDNGEVTIQGYYAPTNASQIAFQAQADFAEHTYKVVLPNSLGTYTFTAILTEFNLGSHENTKAAEFTAKLIISSGLIAFA